MKIRQVIVLILFAFPLLSYSIDKNNIKIEISVSIGGKPPGDSCVKVLREKDGSNFTLTKGSIINTYDCPNLKCYKRKYFAAMPFNETFALLITPPGYIDKIIQINTLVAEDRIEQGFEPIKFTVVLLPINDSTKNDIYKNRALITYSAKLDDFSYSPDNGYNTSAYNLGVKNSELKNYEEPIKNFTEAIQQNITDIDALYNRGVMKYKLQNIEGACNDWHLIKELGSNDADRMMEKYCARK